MRYYSLLLILFSISSQQVFCQSDKKPNVLLLYMDDLRPELNCYGKNYIHSPNIDHLAKSGIQFNNAYCNVPVCGASRASMLTGMYPTKERFINYNTFASKEVPTAISLPKLFKNNGYTTISNGKVYHHLDDNTDDWDEIYRPYAFNKNNKNLTPTDYWQSIWKDYHDPKNKKTYLNTGNGPAYEHSNVNDTTYIDGLMTQKVIRDLKKLKKSDKPFFLTAGFISNHLPFNAPTKYWNLYPESSIQHPYNNYPQTNIPKIAIGRYYELRAYDNIPNKGSLDSYTSKKLIQGYYATVSYVDALIGKISQTLKELDLEKNTIVILVADHGYLLEEHAEWAKFTNHKLTSQVPLIISSPLIEVNDSQSHSLVELVDIYPTLAELCHLDVPKNQLEGKSFVQLFKNPRKPFKEYVFTKKGNGFTIKTEKYSYTEYINPTTGNTITSTLFDHHSDADENTNISNDPKHKKTIRELSKLLHNNFTTNIKGK
ncbi:sulfatase [Flavicella marina]|uniref:sulfatase n=1 Tax=Flavicella marina TaxID=1475951 RepID=UPI001264BA66|nr:sulfatase [Flavicella marina]